MIFNYTLVLYGLFQVFSTANASKSSVKSASNKNTYKTPNKLQSTRHATRPVTQITQMDFLVTPDDFDKDEDVCYLVKQLHRPQSIEKFYRSAAQVYIDLSIVYREIQTDASIADQFLTIMKKLTAASLNEPLTVTNLMFAAAKHLRPLFKHQSTPIEEIFATISELEKDPNRKMIRLMTQFFTSFTLREVLQLQNFIKLISLATLANPANGSTGKKSINEGQLDISRTSIEPYAERIRITIANAIAKMLILLDLFVNDPSVATRSVNLIRRLWNLHLRRLALRENVPFEELDIKWLDPLLYRKSAINFSFDDWSPDAVSPESMLALKKAADAAEQHDKDTLALRSSSKTSSRAIWITSASLISILVIFIGCYFYLQRRRRLLQEQQEPQIDLAAFETQSVNDIVSKLERNID